MASTRCQKLLTFFVKKHKILSGSENTIFQILNFTSMWSKYLPINVCKDFRLPLELFFEPDLVYYRMR